MKYLDPIEITPMCDNCNTNKYVEYTGPGSMGVNSIAQNATKLGVRSVRYVQDMRL